MIIIRAMETLPCHVAAALAERLRVMPATIVTGARQTGKSTLAERLVTSRRRYVSLDDLDVIDAARPDPGTDLEVSVELETVRLRGGRGPRLGASGSSPRVGRRERARRVGPLGSWR
jgi:hypothetical protein